MEMKTKEHKVSRVMTVSVVTNILLAISKIVSGIVFTSTALIADGIHSFSDLVTDFFAIIGSHISQKPADLEHPFGHGNAEYLTSLGISVMILGVGVGVIYNSLLSKAQVSSAIVIVVSLLTIFAKYFLSSYIIRKGKQYKNAILLSSGKESRTDVVSSIVVLFSSILIQFSDQFPILLYAEKAAAILIGLFIFGVGIGIMRENISTLLGQRETNEDYLNRLRQLIAKQHGVVNVKDVILMRYGSVSTLNLIITMKGNTSLRKSHDIADILETKIKKFSHSIQYIQIHIEPEESE